MHARHDHRRDHHGHRGHRGLCHDRHGLYHGHDRRGLYHGRRDHHDLHDRAPQKERLL